MNVKSTSNFETPGFETEGNVWVERVATRQLIGYNQRGVEIPIGKGEGQISPGELLKMALAGCAGMSMDIPTSRRLGDDFALRIVANADADETNDRYTKVAEQIQLDLSEYSEEEAAKIVAIIGRTIDAACTIQRTVEPGVPVTHEYLNADGTQIKH